MTMLSTVYLCAEGILVHCYKWFCNIDYVLSIKGSKMDLFMLYTTSVVPPEQLNMIQFLKSLDTLAEIMNPLPFLREYE